MKFHEAANLFPLLEGDEFEQLVADIKDHGQQEAITLHRGAILDGRNRFRACQRLGVEPLVDYRDDIDDPVSYVISLNIHRRHLTVSQRSAIVAEAMPLYKKQAKDAQRAGQERGRATRHGTDPELVSHQLVGNQQPTPGTRGDAAARAAAAAGVGQGTVIRAEQVMKFAPDLHERVKAGELSGHAAYNETKERRQAERAITADDPDVVRREEEKRRRLEAARKREEDELAARRQRPAAPRKPVRDERTDGVVGVFADIRRVVLAADPYAIAEGMDAREELRVRAAFRDLEEWMSKWDCARADLRTREQLQAAAAATAGPA